LWQKGFERDQPMKEKVQTPAELAEGEGKMP